MAEGDQGELGKEGEEDRQVSMLLVRLCRSQLLQDGDGDSIQDTIDVFVPGLSPAAAAAAT